MEIAVQPNPAKLSVVVLTYRRDDALSSTIDRIAEVIGTDGFQLVLVDNNADGSDRSGMIGRFENAVLVNRGINLGVAAGRNAAIQVATGEVVLFLDDDALLEPKPRFAEALTGLFAAQQELGVVAFRSYVGEERIEDPIEFPHTDKTLPRDRGMETFRFIGVAHAVRRSIFAQIGVYCPSFFYGMEEFDLSFRLMKMGMKIRYAPEFTVRHMKAEAGRLPSATVIRRMYANKLSVGWMHLPLATFLASASAWFLKTMFDARSLAVPFKAIGDFLAMSAHGQLQRRDPSDALVAEVRRLGGKPWR